MEGFRKLLRNPGYETLLAENILVRREEISEFLFISDLPQPVDLCVVLGAPSFSNVDPAVSLYRSGLVERIIITGFGPKRMVTHKNHIPEYAGLRQRALDAGIPSCAILVERMATNTLENFRYSAELIDSQIGWENIHCIAICGKPLHMRRAYLTALTCWPEHIELLMQPTSGSTDLQADTWWHTENGQLRVLTELISIAKYSSKGDISGV